MNRLMEASDTHKDQLAFDMNYFIDILRLNKMHSLVNSSICCHLQKVQSH